MGLPDNPVQNLDKEYVTIVGIVEDKTIQDNQQVVYLQNITFCDMDNHENYEAVSENNIGAICELANGRMQDIYMGNIVKVSGRLQLFQKATNPGEFDLASYYQTKGYFFKLTEAQVTGKSKKYNQWKEWLWNLKKVSGHIYDQILPLRDSNVIKAMVLGDKTNMDPEIKKLYQKNGIAHILAISGLHISIIGVGLYKLLRKMHLPKIIAAIIVMFIIINYAILTGGGTSTIRAVVMFSYYLGADIFGRTNDPPTSLALSALIVIIVSPYYLFYSGFWLSYMAVAGITIFVPAYNKKTLVGHQTKWQKWLYELKSSILSGIAMSYFTLPIVLFFFFEYPIYSVLLNLLIIPFMTGMMYMALLGLAVGSISITVGSIVIYPCHWILNYYEILCEQVQNMPWTSWIVGRPSIIQILLFYIITLGIVYYSEKELVSRKIIKLMRWKISPLAVKSFFMCLAIVVLIINTDSRLKITFLDVGQGDGICMELPDNRVIMIDGGSSSKNNLAKYQLVPFLKYQGISKINYWCISHPDLDHYSGLIEVLGDEKMYDLKIEHLLLPDAEGMREQCKEIVDLAYKKGIDVIWVSKGDHFELSGVKINVLHPQRQATYADINEASMVLMAEYNNTSVLLTGDATTESEEYITCDVINGTRILKVAHHGSKTSTSEKLLREYMPTVAIVSCGKNNRYGHPNAEVLERIDDVGGSIYRTDEIGAISIKTDGNNLQVQGFCVFE